MRIVCPTCSASYEVPDQLMTGGRVVRCVRCSGEWTPVSPAEPPEPERPPLIESEAPPPPPSAPEPEDSRVIGEVRRSAMARLAAQPATRRPSFGLRLAWAGSIVVFILLIAMAFAWRSEIIALWPPSARAYSALGLHPEQQPSQ